MLLIIATKFSKNGSLFSSEAFIRFIFNSFKNFESYVNLFFFSISVIKFRISIRHSKGNFMLNTKIKVVLRPSWSISYNILLSELLHRVFKLISYFNLSQIYDLNLWSRHIVFVKLCTYALHSSCIKKFKKKPTTLHRRSFNSAFSFIFLFKSHRNHVNLIYFSSLDII